MLRRLHGHLSPPPPAAAAAAASERTEASPAAPATPGLSAAQLAAYERDGFLTLPSVLAPAELVALREESERIIDGFPTEPGGTQDRHGRTPICQPAFGPVLGDPMAQRTDPNRHSGVKLSTYTPREAESVQVPYKIGGWLAYSHPFRQLYGHPVLCAAAESVYGPDFVPFNESMVIKRGEVAPAISWHQDGGTHWDDPQPEHGFNFMVNLWDCDEENALWVVRGSHRMGKLDVPALQAEHGERLEGCGALPLLARAGDVTLVNRNCVHGSFPNRSSKKRTTIIHGFHPRSAVEGVHDPDAIALRSRVIPLCVSCRQAAPYASDEVPYEYTPLLATAAAAAGAAAAAADGNGNDDNNGWRDTEVDEEFAREWEAIMAQGGLGL